MNLPNVLTVFRILLIPFYVYVFFSPFPYHIQWAFLILVVAGLTDIIDGYIARTYKLVTPFGAVLDPLADKLLTLAVVASFFLSERISIWAALFLFLRDAGMIIIGAIFHLRGKHTVQANAFGKLTTVFFYIAFTLVMFDYPYGEEILWVVIAFSFITSAIYLVKFRLMNRAA